MIGTCFVLVTACAAAVAAPVNLYVSPHGNDGSNGQSTQTAFATLTRAREELRKAKAAGQLGEGAVVNVLPGLYYLSETFKLGPDDSGTEQAPVVWRSAEPGKAILYGGKAVTGWRPYQGKILQSDLKANGLAGRRYQQLFFQGQRQVLARYPNLDPKDPHGGQWAFVAGVQGDEQRTEFSYGEDENHKWAHPADAQVHIFPYFDWAWNILPIAKVDFDQRKITLKGSVSYALHVGDRYFVDGLLEELDTPGEWYLDPYADVLYFWPPADLSAGPVVVPLVDTVVSLQDAASVTIQGFTIEACDGDAVTVTNSKRCVVAGNVVRNCAGWGINVSGGEQSGARGNDVYQCGCGGISVTAGDRKTLTPGHCFADNNYVHHCAVIQRTYQPGVNVNGVGNTVSHNLIHDFPHAGLLLGGNDNIVEYNVVHHVNLQSGDTGGIYYCSRDWTQRGNVIRYNIFHHCGGFGKTNSWAPLQGGKVEFRYPHFTWGIYLDDPTTGTLVYGNILYQVPVCALHNHGGRDNTWENNIIIDAPALQAGMLDPNWSEWKDIYQRLHDAEQPGSPYLAKYPELANYADTHPEEMSGVRFLRNIVYYTKAGTDWWRKEQGTGNVMHLYDMCMRHEDFPKNEWDGNCIYAERGIDLRIGFTFWGEPGKQLSWDEWRALGTEKQTVLADPKFVDPASHDYRLQPDSPALKLGFKPIPVDKIGPYQDPARASWPIKEAPGVAALGEFTTVRYYEPPQYKRVKAQEFVPRGGVGNFLAKAAAGRELRVAYFGGGIHAADGWRKSVMDGLRAKYGKVTEIDASICDCVRGSGFSVWRFGHDVLAQKPDLVLIDFASDDFQLDPVSIFRNIEGVIRQAWEADPNLDIVLLYAFRDGYEKDYAEGLDPAAISAYERVADRYGIPSINMGYRIAQAVAAGGKSPLQGGVRPTPEANKSYGDVITAALQQLAVGGASSPTPHKLPAPLQPDNYEHAKQVAITPEMLTKGWRPLPPTDPLCQRLARQCDTIWFTDTPGAKLTFKFQGTEASIYDLMGPDTGRARVTVDGKDMGIREQVDPWSYFQRQASIAIASGLPDAVHTVTVELLPDPPNRSIAIEAAKKLNQYDPNLFQGVALRFGWIRIYGEMAQ